MLENCLREMDKGDDDSQSLNQTNIRQRLVQGESVRELM